MAGAAAFSNFHRRPVSWFGAIWRKCRTGCYLTGVLAKRARRGTIELSVLAFYTRMSFEYWVVLVV